MIKEFLRQLWDWIFLELDFEQTHECGVCGALAVWEINCSIYVCDGHYLWGVNRVVLLEKEIIIKHLSREGGLR